MFLDEETKVMSKDNTEKKGFKKIKDNLDSARTTKGITEHFRRNVFDERVGQSENTGRVCLMRGWLQKRKEG